MNRLCVAIGPEGSFIQVYREGTSPVNCKKINDQTGFVKLEHPEWNNKANRQHRQPTSPVDCKRQLSKLALLIENLQWNNGLYVEFKPGDIQNGLYWNPTRWFGAEF